MLPGSSSKGSFITAKLAFNPLESKKTESLGAEFFAEALCCVMVRD